MTLVKWHPYRTLNNLEKELNHFLGDYTGSFNHENKSDWQPSTQIVEKKNAFDVALELPGVNKEDVTINLKGDVLTIQGEKKSEKPAEQEKYDICERQFGSFARSFTLPKTADPTGIQAAFNNGILSITIPKAEQAQPKNIKIQ